MLEVSETGLLETELIFLLGDEENLAQSKDADSHEKGTVYAFVTIPDIIPERWVYFAV